MSQRIKVTGYIDPRDLDDEDVDLSHSMGLSPGGYERLVGELSLDDIDFKLQPEGE